VALRVLGRGNVRVVAFVAVLGAAVLTGVRLADDRSLGPIKARTDGAVSAARSSSEVVFVRSDQLQLDRAALTISGPDPFRSGFGAATLPAHQIAVVAQAPAASTISELAVPIAPYRFFGQVKNAAGSTQLFLARENQLIPIKVGEVLDGQYRVAAITDSTVDLVYLPLNQVQQIGR
jgi:hypothetical protein